MGSTSLENETKINYSDGIPMDQKINNETAWSQPNPSVEGLSCECGYKCRNMYDLNRHRKKTYSCDECELIFRCLSGFRKHKMNEHVKHENLQNGYASAETTSPRPLMRTHDGSHGLIQEVQERESPLLTDVPVMDYSVKSFKKEVQIAAQPFAPPTDTSEVGKKLAE